MMHTPMVCAIKELFHNAKTNINNQPVGKVVSQKTECDFEAATRIVKQTPVNHVWRQHWVIQGNYKQAGGN